MPRCGKAIGCLRQFDDISWNYKVNPLTFRKEIFKLFTHFVQETTSHSSFY